MKAYKSIGVDFPKQKPINKYLFYSLLNYVLIKTYENLIFMDS